MYVNQIPCSIHELIKFKTILEAQVWFIVEKRPTESKEVEEREQRSFLYIIDKLFSVHKFVINSYSYTYSLHITVIIIIVIITVIIIDLVKKQKTKKQKNR